MYFNQAIAVAILAYTAAAAPAGPNCDRQDSVCRKYTANNGLSSVECDVSVAQCIGSCQVTFDRCSTAPNANHATCVAQLVGCTGKSTDESLKPQSATGDAVYQPATKAKAAETSCVLKDDACRTAPGANQAECSAQKAECKDKCSSAADACRTAPGANQSLCSADYAKCLGENPYAKRAEEPHFELGTPLTQPAPKTKAATASSCVLKDDACRTAPGANQAQCSAEKAACKATCQADSDACRTAPGANQSLCSSDFAKCLGENPYAKKRGTPQSSAGAPLYQGNCDQLDTVCRTLPDANMAQCSAETAACKASCQAASDVCRTASGANQAECSAQFAKCLGTNPYN